MTLEAAIRNRNLAGALQALGAGADVNRRDAEGMTPLMRAAGLGLPQMVELLLGAGADVHVIEPRMGAAALHKAAQSDNVDVLVLLLDHGSFIDQQSPALGNTPLMDAVLHKQEAAARLLLDRGARTMVRNHWGQTARDLAQVDKLDAIVHLIDARNEAAAKQVRELAFATPIQAGDVDKVRQLIAQGANVEERTPIVGSLDDDYTPLGLAAREGRADMVRLLLDASADPREVVGLMKGTPVHEAAYFGHAEVLRVITSQRGQVGGAEPELDAQGPYNGLTALHDAVWHGHVEAARVLTEAGVRLDLRTHAGVTPRELALLYGYDSLAQHLAEAAAIQR